MPFVARTRAQIAAQLLAYLSANYASASPPRVLLTAPGSDADLDAQAFAVELEGLEVGAEQATLDMLPDQASPDALARFSYVYNVPRDVGSPATILVDISGAAPATTYPIPARTQLASPDGVLFDVLDTSVTTDGSSEATITAQAANPGTDGNLDAGTAMTFTVAPTGLNPSGSVASVVSDGTDAEDNASLAGRIISRLRERPASGNRADWRAWVTSFNGDEITEAYVYSLLQPPASTPGTGTEQVPGCVTVVAVGPAQGDSTTNTRIVPTAGVRTAGGPLLRVIAYLNGDRDADGVATLTGERLPPTTMVYGDWTVEAINTQAQDVVLQIVPTAANAFPFTSSPGVDSSSTSSSLVVSGNYGPGGIEDLSGLSALVYIGTANIRGGYERVTLGTGTYDGGTLKTTFPVTLSHAPVTPSFVYAAPPCWADLRATVFDYFDGLGPGDTSTPVRWPTQDTNGRATLYRTALGGVVTEVSGVLSAEVTTPALDVTPGAKTVVTLGSLLVTP